MKVYTIQMAQWRLAKEKGIPLVDITVKSGMQALAPTWRMVTLLKAGAISEQEFAELYLEKLRDDDWANREEWTKLMSNDTMALACYCRAGEFCHRYLLADYLKDLRQKQTLPFTYGGEILPETNPVQFSLDLSR